MTVHLANLKILRRLKDLYQGILSLKGIKKVKY